MLPWHLLEVCEVRADRLQDGIVEPAPAKDAPYLRVGFKQGCHPEVHLAKPAFVELRQIPRVDVGLEPGSEAARRAEEAQR